MKTTLEHLHSMLDIHLPEGGSIDASTRLTEDLNLDSLDRIDLGMSIDEQFGIELGDEIVQAIKTIGEVVELIDSKKP